jgi:hypothetical protein
MPDNPNMEMKAIIRSYLRDASKNIMKRIPKIVLDLAGG